MGPALAATLRTVRDYEPITEANAARHVDLSKRKVKRALRRLVNAGLVIERGTHYLINDGNMLAGTLREALDARQAALNRMRRLAEEAGSDLTVAVYAQPDPTKIGVLLIHEPDHSADAAEVARIYRSVVPPMVGRQPHIDIVSATELSDAITNGDRVALRRWWRSITVAGPDATQLMMQAERLNQS